MVGGKDAAACEESWVKMKRKHLISPDFFARFGLGMVAVLFASFLILLADQVMEDLGHWITPPELADFAQTAALPTLDAQIRELENAREQKAAEAQTIAVAVEVAARDYSAAAETYDNWLKARKSIASPEQDGEILARVRTLDQRMAIRQQWTQRLDAIEAERRGLEERIRTVRIERAEQDKVAHERYQQALDWYDLKTFGWRLAIALPFLAGGIFVFIRWRQARYAPLAWGYILFSVYVFFFGLVPYLPSFGGYLRYGIGALLTAAGGIYAIRGMRAYAERKQEALRASLTERTRRVDDDTALEAFHTHRCPSCDHDYLETRTSPNDLLPGYCPHCGLPLFGPCPACAAINFVHFNYCKACGSALRAETGSLSGPPP